MIHQTHDPILLNQVANSPEVLPFIGPDLESVDLSHAMDPLLSSEFVVLSNESETAISLWERKAPGVYEGHALFTHWCRGSEAFVAGKMMLDWMVRHHPVVYLYSQVPLKNRHAQMFCRKIGMKYVGRGWNQFSGDVETFVFSPAVDPVAVLTGTTNNLSQLVNTPDYFEVETHGTI